MREKIKFLCFVLFLTILSIILNVFSLKEYDNIELESKIIKEANYIVSNEMADTVLDIVENYQPIVYDGLTLEELANKLNKSLNSSLSGKGMLIASYSLEKGVDPYMAVAIMLQETGCKWDCSYLVKTCNNVGGQIGSGCGTYNYFETLDIGITSFIDNLYYNYVAYGLTTPETINPKYAQDQSWSYYVNNYINEIKAQ